MKLVKPLLFVALAAMLIATPAASQDSITVKKEEDGKFQFTPNPKGDEIKAFIDIIVNETSASVVFDPASPQVRGRKIEIKGPVTIERKSVFDWVRSVLSFQRLILVPTGPRQANTWMLVDLNAPQITNHPEYVPEDELEAWADKDGAYIVSTITMKHLGDTSRARNAVAQLSTRQIGRINDIPQTRSFIVGDFAPVVVSMWKLLKSMDEEAGKLSPEERAKLDPRRRTPKPAKQPSTIEQLIEKYEQRLMGCQTPHAAQYFLSKILELNTKLEKEKADKAAAAKETAAVQK